ncbi:MAG: thiol:disulfide interchange protein TlpA [Rhizobiaceae bacterium]
MKLNTRTLVSLALLVGIGVVVFGAVYGIWGSVGNHEQQANACKGSQILAKRLEGLNNGQVAAFIIGDEAKPLGELTFKDENGVAGSLEDYRGKTVLLNLWATWCAPCREEMPALDALQQAMGGDEFEVLPISVDLGDDVKPKNFYRETGIKSLPFRHDGTMSVFNDLKKMSLAVGMPVTILVDGEGCALGAMNGPADWASEDAKAMIRAVLGKSEAS